MSPLLILVTTAALGVEVGWEPLASGGHEYTIQIEPQLLGMLERGTEEILSDVPPELNVRRYRIKVGTGSLPRNVGEPARAETFQPEPRRPTGSNDFDSVPPAGASHPDGVPPAEDARSKDHAEMAPAFPIEPPPAETGRAPIPRPGGDDSGGDLLGSDADRRPADLKPPGKLPPDGNASGPIEPAGFDAQEPDDAQAAAGLETQKPMLPDAPSRPWTALVVSVVLLCCSLGANIYLGWVAWGARRGYHDAVAKLRTAS